MPLFVVEDRGRFEGVFASLAEAKRYAKQWAQTPVKFIERAPGEYWAMSPNDIASYTIKVQEMDIVRPVKFIVRDAKNKAISPEFKYRYHALKWLVNNCKPKYPREFYVDCTN